MLNPISESTQEQSPANDFENLVPTQRGLHQDRVEYEEQVAMIREDSSRGFTFQQVVQLSEGLNKSEGFSLVCGSMLFSLSECRAKEGQRFVFLVHKSLFELFGVALSCRHSPEPVRGVRVEA